MWRNLIFKPPFGDRHLDYQVWRHMPVRRTLHCWLENAKDTCDQVSALFPSYQNLYCTVQLLDYLAVAPRRVSFREYVITHFGFVFTHVSPKEANAIMDLDAVQKEIQPSLNPTICAYIIIRLSRYFGC